MADIHANVHALTAVLEHLNERKVSSTYRLGDLVGYAAFPNETVDLIRNLWVQGVTGNHGSTVTARYEHCGCKYEDAHRAELSHLSYGWTLAKTRPSTKEQLGRLPFRLDLRPDSS